MATSGFFEKYDAGTLTKLKIFELYVQEWIPVFVSQEAPPFTEVHIFDLFSGPGTDLSGVPGSPLRILGQLREYQRRGMSGWGRVKIVAHFSDEDRRMIDRLRETLAKSEWQIPGVIVDLAVVSFKNALERHRAVLENRRAAKLLILDQFGVDEIKDDVFKQLVSFPTADFIFFLSSATLHRFRDHPAIRIKIARLEDSYDVHRAAIAWFKRLCPPGVYLSPFSIRKGSNIYGLIFGTKNLLGAHKFLQVAWENDDIRGEANFDIDRDNIAPGELVLPMDVMRPKKIQVFEVELERALASGEMKTEADIARYCIQAGMTCQHATPVLKKLKAEGVIDCGFRTPDVRFRNPRPIQVRHQLE